MVRKLTQARSEGKEVLRYSDFQQVVCDLQALNLLYREKVAEVLRDSGKGRAYHIINNVLFFKDRVIMPVQGALRRELLKAYYNNPRTGYRKTGQTFKLLSQNFY